MAINLAIQHAKEIATMFTAQSFLGGKTSQMYNFTGVKGLRIWTPQTTPLNDYTRNGANRYGTPKEMEDTVQELVMGQDKSFALTIDKGNNDEQMNTKVAGKMLNLQIAEQVVPLLDKYAFSQYVKQAGNVVASAKPTKATIIEILGKAAQTLDDHYVPQSDRFLFVTSEMYNLIRLSPEFVGLEGLGVKAVTRGMLGELFGMPVIKVPTPYLPTNCYFIIWHKSAVLMPQKIQDAKLHQDPPGISGALLEGRWLYDAFVLGARANSIYALVATDQKQATPTVTDATGSFTIASDGANLIKYTIDGSDPRYSSTAEIYSAAVTTSGWAENKTVRAVGYSNNKFTSDVAAQSITKA